MEAEGKPPPYLIFFICVNRVEIFFEGNFMGCIQQTIVEDKIKTVEDLMRAQIIDYHPDLKAAIEMILSSGGKRIRPKIVLLLGDLINSNKEPLLMIAAAIELLHTATLVHDDLIDSSILRRGVPTINYKWSSSATVLTGDFLFAAASDLASRSNSIEVMRLFSRTLMTIVNGEVNQMFSKGWDLDKNAYYQRIYAKTASLFETSAYAPALISDLSSDKMKLLREFGKELGMAFQIYDDILDYVGEESKIGKPIGGDLRQGLVTLPLLIYLNQYPKSKIAQKIFTGENSLDGEEIQLLLINISKSDAILLAQCEAHEYLKRAKTHIMSFPNKPEREGLINICESLVLPRIEPVL